MACLGYIAISILCLLDKKGKEVYFDEDPNTGASYTFAVGMGIKLFSNTEWTVRTEDWGYFYRAFEETMKDSNSYWKDYDVWLAIVITAGVTGIMWIINSIIEIRKFAKAGWDLASCV